MLDGYIYFTNYRINITADFSTPSVIDIIDNNKNHLNVHVGTHDDIELLLDSIYGRLKTRLGVGELADFKADGKIVKCEIIEVQSKRMSPVVSFMRS